MLALRLPVGNRSLWTGGRRASNTPVPGAPPPYDRRVPVDPSTYAWLSSSRLEVAGCVTVVVDPEPAAVEKAFGAEPADQDLDIDQVGEDGAWAWFVHLDGATVVVEENGFQGIRDEVLRPASKASAAGKAASVFWNVNGQTWFHFARRGKQVGSIDLIGPDDKALEAIPASLRRLASLCRAVDNDSEDLATATDEGAVDEIAIGAAMVQQFTGIAFGPEVLERGEPRRLTPPAAHLDTPDEHRADYAPTLREGITALSPVDQRAFAAWVIVAAAAEAGMDTEPSVAAMLQQVTDPENVPTPVPGLDALAARMARESDARWMRGLEDDDLYHDLESAYLAQQQELVYGARHVAHPDPWAAAILAADSGFRVYAGSRLERGAIYREDDRGRWYVGSEPNPRGQQFLDLLERLVRSPRAEWGRLAGELPVPLTAEQRAEAVRRDQERRDRGEFQTYQIARSEEPPQAVLVDPGGEEDWILRPARGAFVDGEWVVVTDDEDSSNEPDGH